MTGTDLARPDDPTAAAPWTPDERAMLSTLGVTDATEADLRLFAQVAQRTGLDPFLKQIYMLGRRTKSRDGRWETKQTIQAGIDGLRLAARRAANRDGHTLAYEDTAWAGPDGEWRTVWLGDEPPRAARVVVLRDGHRFPAIVLYSEYVQTTANGEPNSMWRRMPANQLAKCAEAAALRRAFPNDLSQLYVDAEVPGDDGPGSAAVHRPGDRLRAAVATDVVEALPAAPDEDDEKQTPQQNKLLHRLFRQKGFTGRDDALEFIGLTLGGEPVASTKDLTRSETVAVISALEALDDPAPAVVEAETDVP